MQYNKIMNTHKYLPLTHVCFSWIINDTLYYKPVCNVYIQYYNVFIHLTGKESSTIADIASSLTLRWMPKYMISRVYTVIISVSKCLLFHVVIYISYCIPYENGFIYVTVWTKTHLVCNCQYFDFENSIKKNQHCLGIGFVHWV